MLAAAHRHLKRNGFIARYIFCYSTLVCTLTVLIFVYASDFSLVIFCDIF